MIKEEVKKEMQAQGIHAAELAAFCNCSKSTMSGWLSGDHNISYEKLEKVLERLGLKIVKAAE